MEADTLPMSKPAPTSRYERQLGRFHWLQRLALCVGTSLVALLCSGSVMATTLQLNLVPPEVVEQRLQAGAVPAAKRQETIRKLFVSVGCSPEEQAISKKQANVICTLLGETQETILMGGHFDFAERGQGIVDDWSGTALLPSLYQTLKDERHHATVRHGLKWSILLIWEGSSLYRTERTYTHSA